MEHFAVVLALSRMALHADAKRSAHQIERLRDALVAEGEHRQAAMISGLLERWDSGGDPDQPPMRLEPMRGRRMELTQAVTLGLKERGKADRQSKKFPLYGECHRHFHSEVQHLSGGDFSPELERSIASGGVRPVLFGERA